MSWAALATKSGLSPTNRAPHGFCCSAKPSTSRPMWSDVGFEVFVADTLTDILASLSIINAVAVANIEAALGAVPPDRVLDEPGEHGGGGRIEGAGIDPLGHGLNDVSASAFPGVGRDIGVVGAEPGQEAGAVHGTLNEGIDSDHACG